LLQGPQPLIEGLRRSSLAPLAGHRSILGNHGWQASHRPLSFGFLPVTPEVAGFARRLQRCAITRSITP
jgi:hypothetical protein